MRVLLFVLLFVSVHSFAQELTLGPEEKGSRKEIIQKIVHYDTNGEFYALRQSIKLFAGIPPIIEKYSSDMKLIYSVPLKDFSSQYVTPMEFFSFNNRIFVSVAEKDVKRKRINYSCIEIDKRKGVLTGDKIKIGSEVIEKKSARGNLNYIISQDSTKLGLFVNDFSFSLFSTFSFGKKVNTNYEKFTLKVLDKNLQEIWSKKVRLPYNKDRLSVLKYDVDNNGNLYVLTKYREENWRALKKDKKPFFSYKMLAYRANGEEKVEYDLTLENKHISDITFNIDKNNNLVCSGFFSKNFKGGLAGAFYFGVDAQTKEITKESYKEFDTSELSLFMSERKAKKGKEISNSFDLDDIILRSDGGAILVGESFWITTYTTTSPSGGTTTRTIYNYGPILVVSVNPDGQIDWVSKIIKRQKAETVAFSFILCLSFEINYFLFITKALIEVPMLWSHPSTQKGR